MTPDPLITGTQARRVLGACKGSKAVTLATLAQCIRLGLPKHQDPFGGPHPCFRESEILAWVEARTKAPMPTFRGPGRPTNSRSGANRQAAAGSAHNPTRKEL